MSDPMLGFTVAALLFTLLAAMLMPAPSRPVEDDARLGLGLIVGGCVAALAMGVLALADLTSASAVMGAVAWLLVTPCVWLARAPQAAGGWYEEDDDDDGGSPSPDAPAAPPVPNDTLPGLQPASVYWTRTPPPQPASVNWTPPAQPAPVMALGARVQQMRAAQETERLAAAQHVGRILAAAPPPAPAPPVVVPAGAPLAEPVLAPAIAPLHEAGTRSTRPAPRVRDDQHSIGHVLTAGAHARTRRRAAVTRRDGTPATRT